MKKRIKIVAVLLCRISDEHQKDGFSLDSQEKHGQNYCRKRQIQIKQIFSFIETASKHQNRKKFNEAMKYVKELIKQGYKVIIVVEKPDRLTRNFQSVQELRKLIAIGKIEIHFFKDRRILNQNSSPEDFFNDNIQIAVSEYYAMNLARETKKGMIEKASQGHFPSRAPIGYKNIREASSGTKGRGVATIIPDPATKELVKRIFELRAEYKMSYQNISTKVREESLTPPNKKISKSTVEDILKNKFYGGTFIWDGIEYQGKHELYIPRKHFEAVQALDYKNTYTREHPGLFSGFLKCSHDKCNCHILYDPKKKKKSNGDIIVHHYYHCSDGRRVHKDEGQSQRNVSEERIMELLSQAVHEIHISPELAKRVSETLKKDHENATESHRYRIEGYRTAMAQAAQEEDKAYELLSSGIIDEERYKKEVKKARAKKQEYEKLIEDGKTHLSEKFYKTSDRILELSKQALALWKEQSDEEKLFFLKTLLSNQKLNVCVESVNDVNIDYELKKPFKELAEIKKAASESGFLIDFKRWCPEADSNHRHKDFQSFALPTELSGHLSFF